MGIPSYFSHIIRNYSNIIRNLKYFNNENIQFQHLFMDCNSIIYDAVGEIDPNAANFEEKIIENVIEKINYYINIIKPQLSVFITFDGVAPLAKMEQQRSRRHRSSFLSQIDFNEPTDNKKWSTSAITPGTDFMNKLSEKIEYAFSFVEKKYNVQAINISCSDNPGEGEHKLFDYIRKNNLQNDNIALYGLDSDLIMLSIFHIHQTYNIYIFREAPEFIKSSIPVSVLSDTNEPYFLDIHRLCNSILSEMNCIDTNIRRVYDYVFICFFLGNDFLPHFPAMNIRTHGIDTLLTLYSQTIGKKINLYILNENNKINWNCVRMLLYDVSNKERDLLIEEMNSRKRYDSFKFQETTIQDKERLFQNIPILYRKQEKYISPDMDYWEDRYYKTLFKEIPTGEMIKDVCMNYLEMLEWVFKYYTGDCVNWRIKYNYHYPPLFKDLIQYIPHFEMDFLAISNSKPFHPYTQLSYVLPVESHYLLPEKIKKFLSENYGEFYNNKISFEWAFCKYFWEAHPILPGVPVSILSLWNSQFELFV
jgi:5'-3' exonuclease